MKTKVRWRRLAWKALKDEKENAEKSYSNLENANPELCIKMLGFPSVHNIHGVKKKIENSDNEWLEEFLFQNGLVQLFLSLDRLSEEAKEKKQTDLWTETELVECARCLKAIVNSETGLEFLISQRECLEMLAKTLCNRNTSVKMVVFELLSAMALYSGEGKTRALLVLELNKRFTPQRYRFSMLINEIRSSKNLFYKTSLLLFINALLLSTKSLPERIRLRKELMGLQLLDILYDLRTLRFEDLLVQIDVFDDQKLKDDDEVSLSRGDLEVIGDSPKDVFEALFQKICNTPHVDHLVTVLHCMLQLNPDDNLSDIAWEILAETAGRVTVIKSREEAIRMLKHKAISESPARDVVDAAPSECVSSMPLSDDSDVSEEEPELTKIPAGLLLKKKEEEEEKKPPQLTTIALPLHPPPPPPPPVPPPIGGDAQPIPPGLEVPKPNKKLRKVNWHKLSKSPNKSDNIWNELNSGDYSIEPNYKAIEVLFANKVDQKRIEEMDTPHPVQTTFIEQGRSMNVGIFLHHMQKSNEEIVNALKEGNRNFLTEENLKRMKKFLPEDNEIDDIKGFTGDEKKLANVDKYFLLLSKLPFYELRIDAGIARVTFEENMQAIVPDMRSVKSACKVILQSDNLRKFFLLILKTGNYLNYGSFAGNAYGFKISSISKLEDTKANKPGMNLLHYVAEMVEKEHSSLLDLPKEMEPVISCKEISVQQLKEDTKTLTSTIANLKDEIKEAPNDVQKQYKGFLKDADRRTASFHKELEDIDKLSEELAAYLVENPKKFKLDKCFSTFADFFEQFSVAVKENKDRVIMEEKRKKRESMLKPNNHQPRREGQVKPSPQQRNVLDNLLKDMKGFNLRKAGN